MGHLMSGMLLLVQIVGPLMFINPLPITLFGDRLLYLPGVPRGFISALMTSSPWVSSYHAVGGPTIISFGCSKELIQPW